MRGYRWHPPPQSLREHSRGALCAGTGSGRAHDRQRDGAGHRHGGARGGARCGGPDDCGFRLRRGRDLSGGEQEAGRADRARRADPERVSNEDSWLPAELSGAQPHCEWFEQWSFDCRRSAVFRFGDYGAAGPRSRPGGLCDSGEHYLKAKLGAESVDPAGGAIGAGAERCVVRHAARSAPEVAIA